MTKTNTKPDAETAALIRINLDTGLVYPGCPECGHLYLGPPSTMVPTTSTKAKGPLCPLCASLRAER